MDLAEQLFAMAKEDDLTTDGHVLGALIRAYAKCNEVCALADAVVWYRTPCVTFGQTTSGQLSSCGDVAWSVLCF